jgi:hypothetical protein
MRTLHLGATLAFAALVCGVGGSASARAGELILFPYTYKCPAGWSAQQAGPAKGLTWCAGSRAGDDDAFVGELRLFAFVYCPQPGWVQADGAVYSINRNAALYVLVDKRFGGDGKMTFALPNVPGAPAGMTWCVALNGRFPQR